jgi:hypothetical protein
MKKKSIITSYLLLLLIISCAPKTLPPELKPAYTANEVLIRVQELQTLTIKLYDSTPPLIPKDKAELIVKFTIVAAELTSASLNGWINSLKRSWIELNKQMQFNIPENLQLVWKLVDAVIMAL